MANRSRIMNDLFLFLICIAYLNMRWLCWELYFNFSRFNRMCICDRVQGFHSRKLKTIEFSCTLHLKLELLSANIPPIRGVEKHGSAVYVSIPCLALNLCSSADCRIRIEWVGIRESESDRSWYVIVPYVSLHCMLIFRSKLRSCCWCEWLRISTRPRVRITLLFFPSWILNTRQGPGDLGSRLCAFYDIRLQTLLVLPHHRCSDKWNW